MTDIRTKYDRIADVLYVTTSRNGPAYATEDENGIVWRYLATDQSLVGATIIDFDSYWKLHMAELATQIADRFSLPRRSAKTVLEAVR